MKACIAILMLAALCFGAQGARAATGGTSVAVDGASATITVRFDLCCFQDATEQTIYGPLVQAEVQAAQDMWNAALAKLPGKGCYNLKAVFDVRLLNEGEPWDPDYHQIKIDYERPGRSFSTDPGGYSRNDDDDTVYNQTVGGQFYETSMSVGTWAHEIGHLMGLGDDYYDPPSLGHARSSCLGGRDGTLMCGSQSGTIDQALADRLADILNIADRLPQCWKGTLTAHGQGNVYNDQMEMSFTFLQDAHWKITGAGKARMAHLPAANLPDGCVHTRTMAPEEFATTLNGARVGEEFELLLGTMERVTVQYSAKCGSGSVGPNTVAGVSPFVGIAPLTATEIRIPTLNGSSPMHATIPQWEVNGEITIECASCTRTPRPG